MSVWWYGYDSRNRMQRRCERNDMFIQSYCSIHPNAAYILQSLSAQVSTPIGRTTALRQRPHTDSEHHARRGSCRPRSRHAPCVCTSESSRRNPRCRICGIAGRTQPCRNQSTNYTRSRMALCEIGGTQRTRTHKHSPAAAKAEPDTLDAPAVLGDCRCVRSLRRIYPCSRRGAHDGSAHSPQL